MPLTELLKIFFDFEQHLAKIAWMQAARSHAIGRIVLSFVGSMIAPLLAAAMGRLYRKYGNRTNDKRASALFILGLVMGMGATFLWRDAQPSYIGIEAYQEQWEKSTLQVAKGILKYQAVVQVDITLQDDGIQIVRQRKSGLVDTALVELGMSAAEVFSRLGFGEERLQQEIERRLPYLSLGLGYDKNSYTFDVILSFTADDHILERIGTSTSNWARPHVAILWHFTPPQLDTPMSVRLGQTPLGQVLKPLIASDLPRYRNLDTNERINGFVVPPHQRLTFFLKDSLSYDASRAIDRIHYSLDYIARDFGEERAG
jgi:hypothetical protein